MRISDWSSDVCSSDLDVRGAGDSAEDLFQDLWMRLTDRRMGPIADALPYIMRAANNLMLDRYRSARQRDLRDKAWGEASATQSPSSERALISREQLTLVVAAIAATGERPAQRSEEHTSELQSLMRTSY